MKLFEAFILSFSINVLMPIISDLALSVNFVTTSILSTLNKLEIGIDELFITPKMLSDVIKLVSENKLSMDAAKKLLYEAIDKKTDPIELVKARGMGQINDEDTLLKLIQSIMDENLEVVRQYVEDGNMSAVNFFVGQIMKKSNRQANPNISRELISKELERRKNNG